MPSEILALFVTTSLLVSTNFRKCTASIIIFAFLASTAAQNHGIFSELSPADLPTQYGHTLRFRTWSTQYAFSITWSRDHFSVNKKTVRFWKILKLGNLNFLSYISKVAIATAAATQSRLSSVLLVNSEIFKLSLNLSLTHLRTQSACYELKGDLSRVMLKEIFHDRLKISKFTRICIENHSSVTGWQKLFCSYKSFLFSVAVAIATFEIYGWKLSGYLILICPFSSC